MATAYALGSNERVNWFRPTTFLFALIHLAPFLALTTMVTEVTAADWVICLSLYVARMFFITGGYHRYFAHRSFKTSRVVQFLMAFGGATAAQKGPLWWAAHHRHHHRFSDQPEDIHSPLRGFWWSHMGWFLCTQYKATNFDDIKDYAKFPELVWLNRFHGLAPVSLAVGCYLYGGLSTLLIGFCLSTTITYHCTYFINSLTHLFGRRRYVTTDTSRNSFILAVLTLGEGWHNNHHYYQSTANQGFFWWEIDVSYYILKVMSWLGLVWDLRTPPKHIRDGNRVADAEVDTGMEAARLAIANAARASTPAQTA